ncbi:MAG: putative hemolysin [Nanobdellota archaeon]
MVIIMKIIKILFVLTLLVFTGCAQKVDEKQTGIANPASEYCIEQGGSLNIIDTPNGQKGMCTLSSGQICEEWSYFRGECPENETNIKSDLAKNCEDNGGKWLEQFNECEGIGNESCQEMGGNFNQCASACRNDPNATVCTMQCVPVCELGNSEEMCGGIQGETCPEGLVCDYDGNYPDASGVCKELNQLCESNGGKWLEKHQECEFMPEDKCVETNGEFYECESACRHSDSDICTKQCVQVCKY